MKVDVGKMTKTVVVQVGMGKTLKTETTLQVRLHFNGFLYSFTNLCFRNFSYNQTSLAWMQKGQTRVTLL